MALLEATGIIPHIFQQQRLAAAKLRTEPLDARKARLRSLRAWIHANRPAIHEAMNNDFGKHPTEVDAIEVFHVLSEIKEALDNLDRWSRPRKVDAPLTMLGTRSSIYVEPKGVCLIISPWNYPFSLAIGPLVSALAAGNAVMIKPSEMTPSVSSLIARMCRDVFTPEVVSVAEGDAETAKELLALPFDHIFFTGSPAIGKIVMRAAAEHLASVTLELGGKSPAIVSASANLEETAERIAVAKFVNNGQTCVAPDYVLADQSIADRLAELIALKAKKFFAANGEFQSCSSYCRIVNRRHFDRLQDLLNDALEHGARPVLSGTLDPAARFFHPFVLANVSKDSRLMEEEIFGPILPILTYDSEQEAIEYVNSKPKALALYLYARSNRLLKKVIAETSAGGVCVNDSGIHFLHSNLPFGGVNNSGIGKSHGHYGFQAFSNEKPVLRQKSGLTSVRIFYPPYTKWQQRIMDWFLKLF